MVKEDAVTETIYATRGNNCVLRLGKKTKVTFSGVTPVDTGLFTTPMASPSIPSKPVDPMAQIVLGAGVSIALHPVTLTKTLIQLGYEPLAPIPTTTIFGRKALVYPNAYQYLKHIRATDGFWGLYRGVWPRVFGGIVGSLATQHVSNHLKEVWPKVVDEDLEESTTEDFKRMCKDTCIEGISRCGGIIVSQPFIVIMTRSMAQFVGKETKYDNIFSSLATVFREEGILGFFKGVLARLAGELITVWLVNVLVFAADKFVLQGNKNLSTYNNAACTMMVAQLTYPFQLVSTLMAVNGSGLAAGSPPHMTSYKNWVDCFASLMREAQLKRGSSLFWRYYKGPVILTGSGQPMPAKQAFH